MLGRSCGSPAALRSGRCLQKKLRTRRAGRAPVRNLQTRTNPMQIIKLDPRALKENPDRMRQTKSSPQADALMLATIKAVGIVQPPVVAPETDGGNGYIIDAGHRRVRLAIAP